MNRFEGMIQTIQGTGALWAIQVDCHSHLFQVMVIASDWQVGQKVALLFKETELILGLASQQESLALSNHFPVQVTAIQPQDVVTHVHLTGLTIALSALVPTSALRRVTWTVGTELDAWVNGFSMTLMAL